MASNEEQTPQVNLPPSLVANILSYNLHTLVDVARLRELNKSFGRLAVSLIPSLAPQSGHFLPTSDGTNDFVHQLTTPPPPYRDGWSVQGASFFAKLWEDFQEKPVREGVGIVDGLVSAELEALLNGSVDALVQKQDHEGAVDYHPNSNDVVRDIVHPALYSYVSGVSVVGQLPPFEPCNLPALQNSVMAASATKRDFWGRKYEDSKYQWLPTTFSIDQDGSCAIEEYINNLVPREANRDLYDSLSKLFEQCLPFVESVYSYVCSIQPHLRTEYDIEYDPSPLPSTRNQQFVSLRGQKLQVITKIVDYELQPEQSHEGVWHVEGMSHEEIVLTCLYILDRDDSIDGGDLEFKRAFFDKEAAFINSHISQASSSSQDKMIVDGLKPLGTVETLKGRLIVFPNSHVHRVTKMLNSKGTVMARRRIVVFFLVNPLCRIISTREVSPQQAMSPASTTTEGEPPAKKQQRGFMSLEEAKKHRLELMKERKYTKQDWNVREIELCEH